MALYCSNCGKELADNQDVCLNCGVKVIKNEVKEKVDNNEEILAKKANTGMILGLISIVAWLLPLAGYPVSICGIVFSSKGLNSTTKHGQAIAGLSLSIIFLIMTLINSIAGAIMTMALYS